MTTLTPLSKALPVSKALAKVKYASRGRTASSYAQVLLFNRSKQEKAASSSSHDGRSSSRTSLDGSSSSGLSSSDSISSREGSAHPPLASVPPSASALPTSSSSQSSSLPPSFFTPSPSPSTQQQPRPSSPPTIDQPPSAGPKRGPKAPSSEAVPPSTAASSVVTPSLPSLSPWSSHPPPDVNGGKGKPLGGGRRYVFDCGAFGIPKGSPTGSAGPVPSTVRKEGATSGWTGGVETGEGSVRVGEDSYFIRDAALGIADGVGGWAKKVAPVGSNINAGRFSALLMSSIALELAETSSELAKLAALYPPSPSLPFGGPSLSTASVSGARDKSGGSREGLQEKGEMERWIGLVERDLDPVRLMEMGYQRCMKAAASENLQGSSTALVALLRNDELRISHVGDCCLTIVRDGEIHFQTEEMQHSFNYPVQLGTNSKETPENDARQWTVPVMKDDIIVLCSDGMSDNLFDEDILEEISSFSTTSPLSPQSISEALCSRAKAVIEDRRPTSFTPSSPPKPKPKPTPPSKSSPPAPSPAASTFSSSIAAAGEMIFGKGQVDEDEEEGDWASPFAKKAEKCGLSFVGGGKNDDISVLVAIVGDLTSEPPHS